MLQVLCSDSELVDGETVAVGDRISRRAGRVEGGEYGTRLDEVAWRFDRSAAGGGAATVAGTVRAISAVYVDLVRLGDCTWTTAHGTARLEPLSTTAATRRPEEQLHDPEPWAPAGSGTSLDVGRGTVGEDDEHLSGWVIVLDDETVGPA